MVGFPNLNIKFLNILIITVSALVFYLPFEVFRMWGKENSILFIAIPSSPDHTKQRQSLRETWLQLIQETPYSYKFLLGKKMCNIHPYDRRSVYSCERLNISLPKDITESTLLSVNSLRSSDQQVETVLGFSFFIHHPIIIQSLGIQQDALNPVRGKIARVVLRSTPHNTSSLPPLNDLSTKISSVTFYSESTFEDVDSKRYVYKKLLNPVLLPKGFEGMILVEKDDGISHETRCRLLTAWEHGNIFSVLNVITPNSFEANEKQFCVLPSFRFTVKDLRELEGVINRTEDRTIEWNKYVEGMHQQLEVEAAQNQDMLFLDVIDVYRNLPLKMHLFYEWLFENFDVKYVLKTDDDTFIDILKVQEELEEPGDWDWWSCFHIGWPVRRFGKWQETYDYKEEVYPPFPSGAGYVLSERALHFLKYSLNTVSVGYQGEDVALGIWLQGLEPSRHVGDACRWACVEQCHPHSCNVMQLSVPAVYRLWQQYRACDNSLCHCSAG